MQSLPPVPPVPLVPPAQHRIARRGVLGLLAASASLQALPSWAEAYPARPVKVIVPFPPGGSTDVAGRVLGQSMQKTLGQPFVIDNRAGAAGALGMDLLAKSPADGYTLGVGGVGAMVTLELLGRKLPYNADKDVVCIGHMGSLGLAIAVKSDLKVKNMADLLALAKAQPGKLSYGTSGSGSPGHLAFEYLKNLSGIAVVHIPYRGDVPLITDVLGGQIDIGVLTGSGAVAQSKSSNLRLLAVTSAKRFAQLPGVPTVAESGVKGYEADIWNVLTAPAGTPEPVVARLNEALNAAQAEPLVLSQYAAQGLVPVVMTAGETTAFVRREREKWAAVVKKSGAKLD